MNTERIRTVVIQETQLKAFEDYLYERENARATIQKYKSDAATFLRYLGNERRVDKSRVLAYKEWLVTHYAVSSVNSMLASVNQFLIFLECRELTVKPLKVQRSLFLKEEKELSKEEYRKLVKTARQEGKEQIALCMETIAATGIRISELRYFTVEKVKKGRIEICNKGKYRRIFLTDDIRKKLLHYCKTAGVREGQIFVTRTGKPKDRSNLWKEMKRLKEKAGVCASKIFPHNFRHLFARVYYTCTKDLAGLADLLGHSSLNVTRIYTSNTGEVYQKQLEKMTALRI
ncbi:MAG TPA: tyrosine-type recombinase/integrase [Candidatus Blautia merdavium]|uniref:Tyrosine-type recombinase/integrase n=1 Tax=Candidatus Blautia merdavium TaxID=2838494 RepID=A0A9D2PSH7_9FIRM|nr:tyrosine-type recombinase/integrase [Candidatus Blautia merdavium]